MRFGLIDCGLEQFISIAQASERIMGKIGMRLEREPIDPTCDRSGRVHAITKAQYLVRCP